MNKGSFDSSLQDNSPVGEPAVNVQKSAKKSASAFRTISEVANELGVQQHVLRFWETKFSQVRPLKRGGGRRYYRPEDIKLLQKIHQLLYTEGYTIKGVQKLLRQHGKNQILESDFTGPVSKAVDAPKQEEKKKLSSVERDALETMLSELKDLRRLIKAD